jgi:hypothetical protein
MMILGRLYKTFQGGLPKEIGSLQRLKTGAAPHLGKIVFTVIQSYQTTLMNSDFAAIIKRMDAVERNFRGFAYEGAGMGLMQLDCMFPWEKRFQAFVAGPASPYICPAYVGGGLALARLGKLPEPILPRLDPVFGWFLIDGYGWRYGIFSSQTALEAQTVPEHLSAYGRRVFDQGLGRSLWFSTGADISGIVARIATFPEARRLDLWSGVGFACSYAGGGTREDVETLKSQAGIYAASLGMGAAIAAAGRQRSGDLVEHTDLACEVLCGLTGAQAAHVTDIARQDLPNTAAEPAFEIWRQRILTRFASSVEENIQV